MGSCGDSPDSLRRSAFSPRPLVRLGGVGGCVDDAMAVDGDVGVGLRRSAIRVPFVPGGRGKCSG
jgi:hypothetical protein